MTLPTMLPHSRAETLAWCREVDEGPWASLAVPERITYTEPRLHRGARRRGRAHRAGAALDDDRDPARARRGRGRQADGVGRRAERRPAHRGRRGRRPRARLPRHRRRRSTAAGSAWTSRSRAMRRIWAGEPPFEGADPVGPPPVQPGGPPVIAGVMGPKAIAPRRALGRRRRRRVHDRRRPRPDGQRRSTMIRAAWEAAGRTDAPHLSSSIWYALGPDAEDRLPRVRVRLHEDLRRGGRAVGVDRRSPAARPTRCAVRSTTRAKRAPTSIFLVPTTVDPDELARTRDALDL